MQRFVGGHRGQRRVGLCVGDHKLLARRQANHSSQSQLVFANLILLRDQLLLFLLQLHASAKHIDRRGRAGAFLISGTAVDRLVGFHLRPQGLNPGRTGNYQQIGVGHGLHHQIASILER